MYVAYQNQEACVSVNNVPQSEFCNRNISVKERISPPHFDLCECACVNFSAFVDSLSVNVQPALFVSELSALSNRIRADKGKKGTVSISGYQEQETKDFLDG